MSLSVSINGNGYQRIDTCVFSAHTHDAGLGRAGGVGNQFIEDIRLFAAIGDGRSLGRYFLGGKGTFIDGIFDGFNIHTGGNGDRGHAIFRKRGSKLEGVVHGRCTGNGKVEHSAGVGTAPPLICRETVAEGTLREGDNTILVRTIVAGRSVTLDIRADGNIFVHQGTEVEGTVAIELPADADIRNPSLVGVGGIQNNNKIINNATVILLETIGQPCGDIFGVVHTQNAEQAGFVIALVNLHIPNNVGGAYIAGHGSGKDIFTPFAHTQVVPLHTGKAAGDTGCTGSVNCGILRILNSQREGIRSSHFCIGEFHGNGRFGLSVGKSQFSQLKNAGRFGRQDNGNGNASVGNLTGHAEFNLGRLCGVKFVVPGCFLGREIDTVAICKLGRALFVGKFLLGAGNQRQGSNRHKGHYLIECFHILMSFKITR